MTPFAAARSISEAVRGSVSADAEERCFLITLRSFVLTRRFLAVFFAEVRIRFSADLMLAIRCESPFSFPGGLGARFVPAGSPPARFGGPAPAARRAYP